jgi:hypothetical protein
MAFIDYTFPGNARYQEHRFPKPVLLNRRLTSNADSRRMYVGKEQRFAVKPIFGVYRNAVGGRK